MHRQLDLPVKGGILFLLERPFPIEIEPDLTHRHPAPPRQLALDKGKLALVVGFDVTRMYPRHSNANSGMPGLQIQQSGLGMPVDGGQIAPLNSFGISTMKHIL